MTEKRVEVLLSREADLHMHYASMAFPNREVMGLGKVEVLDNLMIVRDIIIPPHEVTGGTVEWKPEMMKQVFMEMAKQGQVLGNWRLWWHSHGTMQTNPSATDTENLAMLADEVDDWMLGIVTNSSHSYKAWMEGRHPISYKISDLNVALEGLPEDEAIMSRVTEMMKGVNSRAPVVVTGSQVSGKATTQKGGGSSSASRKRVFRGYGQGRWGEKNNNTSQPGDAKVAGEDSNGPRLTIAEEIDAYMEDNGYYQGQETRDEDGAFLVNPQTSLGNMGLIQRAVASRKDGGEREALWSLFGIWISENENGINIPLWCMKDEPLEELKIMLGDDFNDIQIVVEMQLEMVRRLPSEDGDSETIEGHKRGNGRGKQSKGQKSNARKKRRAAAREGGK